MNLRCKVCGEKAAGFHFGAFTCEGCKSFFGRCCNNMSIIGECRNNKECVIDKKNRTSCKACRLQKCLLVGMSKSGSRYGRRSNWFKQYFQESEQQRDGGSTARHVIKISNDERIEQPNVAPLLSHSQNDATTSSADLLQSPISSHLGYFNSYFPRLSLNRLISYRGDSKLLLPSTVVPLASILHDDVNVNDYFEKLLTGRYKAKDIVEEAADSDDPLDLSRKGVDERTCNGTARKTLPLDLSVK